jgi:hypothetical protein
MKKHKHVLLLVILSLLISGFTYRPSAVKAGDYSMSMHYTTTVQSDGSGAVEVDLTVSKDLVDVLESQTNQNLNCNTTGSSFDLEDKSEGGNLHCVGSINFKDLDELSDITEDDLGASVNRIEIKDKHFYYDIRAVGGFGSSSGQIKTEVLWVLVLPGKPGENNADTVSGRTLTWDLSNTSSSTHLTAECAIGGGFLGMDTTTMIIVGAVMMSCCCVILLIAAVVVFLLIRRRKKPAAEAEANAVQATPLS